jgi:hypothetical protein
LIALEISGFAESDLEKIIGEPKSKTARWLNGGCIHHFNRLDAVVAVCDATEVSAGWRAGN